MEVKFRATYISESLHYAVGVLEPAGDYALRITDPTHIIMTDPDEWKPGEDPSAVFGLTEEEYLWKDNDLDKLDDLAQKLRTDIPRDRLIAEKNGVRKRDRVESIDYGKYQRWMKERNETRRDQVIERMLAADELFVMYLAETAKPYVFGYSFMMMYENKDMAMEAANEYRKKSVPLIVSSFKKELFNQKDAKSVFNELQVLGYQMIMFIDGEKRQSMLLIRDILKHKSYEGQKGNLIYGNPKLDFALTNLFQFLRTPNLTDRSDPEKFKEAVQKQMALYESRMVEALSEARFLVPTKQIPDGKVTTPILRMQPKKVAEAAEGEAEAAKEQAPAGETKQYLPVFTNGMEFVSDKDKYKAAVMPYDAVLKMIEDGKLDGFVINMRSKCSLPCGKERFMQVEAYRKWREEHPAAQKEQAPAAAEGDAPAQQDTPFVPIVNKKDN